MLEDSAFDRSTNMFSTYFILHLSLLRNVAIRQESKVDYWRQQSVIRSPVRGIYQPSATTTKHILYAVS